jgi:hypothetical protein
MGSFHRDLLAQSKDTDGIITKWDEWGGLGTFNDSYLVRDESDLIRTTADADVWRRRLELPCEIVATQRVWRKLYVVTTSECEF